MKFREIIVKGLLPLKPLMKLLKAVGRRTVFLMVAIALVLSLLFSDSPKVLEIIKRTTKMDTYEQRAFEFVENLQPGDVVLLSADYGPSTRPEAEPIAAAFIKHCFKRGVKVVVMGLWPDGAQMITSVIERIAREYHKQKFVDWVSLGYKPGGAVLIRQMFVNFRSTFPEVSGRPIDEVPVLSGIKTAKDFKVIFSVSAGDPGTKTYVKIANGEFGQKVIGGVTAVSAPEIYPYLHTGQLVGLWAGLKGAATYEIMIDEIGDATKFMFAQSVIHLLIIAFILLGNGVMFYERYVSKL